MVNRAMAITITLFIYTFVALCRSERSVTVIANPSSPAKDSSVSITCSISMDPGDSLVTLYWRYGVSVSNATDIAIWDYFEGFSYGDGYSSDTHLVTTDDIPNGESILTINPVQLTDDGTHLCEVALAGAGRYADSVAIDVTVMVSNIDLSDSTGSFTDGQIVKYLEGNDIDFTCISRGSKPGAGIVWSIGDVPPVPAPPTSTQPNVDDNRLFDSTGVYSHQMIWDSHGKNVQCTASNTASPTGLSTRIRLDIQVPPKTDTIVVYDSDPYNSYPGGAVREGTSHTFRCDITGTRPEAQITWMKGTESLVGQTSTVENGELTNTFGTVTFTPSRNDHKLILRCEADIKFTGSIPVTKQLTLDVYGPPDKPVFSGTVDLTENTLSEDMTCIASNAYDSGGSMVWYMDNVVFQSGGESIPNGNRYDISDALSFTPVRSQNQNSVTCEARHETLTGPTYPAEETTINVKFCSSSVSITRCPSVIVGQQATLSCTSSSSNPVTTLQWYEGDELNSNTHEPIPTEAEYKGVSTTLQFTTRAITRQDYQSVNFKCHAVNQAAKCSEILSTPCSLNVQYPPENVNVQKPHDNPVNEGASISLNCMAEGNPPPDTFTWFQDDTQLGDDTQGLDLETLTRENAGWYRCNAGNGITPNGESQPSAVVVQYAANIDGENETKGVDPKDDVTLECTADGLPDPTFTWYNTENQMISNATDRMTITQIIVKKDEVHGTVIVNRLLIENVKETDYGNYRCEAMNMIGDADTYSFHLNGTTVPGAVKELTIHSITLNALNATWVPSYSGGELLTQYYIVDYRKYTDDQPEPWGNEEEVYDTYFVASGLLEGTTYDIRVFSVNSNGRNEDGQIVKGTTGTGSNEPSPVSIPLIIGLVAGIGLLIPIIILVVILARGKGSLAKKSKGDGNIQLKPSANGQDGIACTNVDAIDETAGGPTYAAVDKTKKKGAPAPTYAAVDKKKKNAKGDAEEDVYDDVANLAPAAMTNPQDDGKVVNADGLIYQEVGHFKSHPVGAPPIQTEAPTDYAALDFNRTK